MSKVANIGEFRAHQRKKFLSRHGVRIDTFIQRILAKHVEIDFRNFAENYLDMRRADDETEWNYDELRDALRESLDKLLGDEVQKELCKQLWYEARWIHKDDIIDRCLSFLVLGTAYTGTGIRP